MIKGDHRRKPQMDSMKRSIDSLEHSPGGYIYITFMLSMPQETSEKNGQKNIVIARIPRRLE